MIKLVRGSAIFALLSLCVVFIYAQTKTQDTLIIANASQVRFAEHISENTPLTSLVDEKDTKALIKKTALVSSAGKGASRGAFSATAYCLSGKTALGHGVRRGIVAADPRVLRLGSTIVINAGPYSGSYLVSDTGGGIKGKRLDIWVPNCSEARKFGRRTIQVFGSE